MSKFPKFNSLNRNLRTRIVQNLIFLLRYTLIRIQTCKSQESNLLAPHSSITSTRRASKVFNHIRMALIETRIVLDC